MANNDYSQYDVEHWMDDPNAVLPTEIDTGRLADLVFIGASGLFHHEASRRLIIRHGYWLKQESFLKFVTVFGKPPKFASIEWKEALEALDSGALVADREEASILRIAGSIATEYAVCLHYATEAIDKENIKFVAEAIMYNDGFLESVAEPRS